jgi:hypothetical protein
MTQTQQKSLISIIFIALIAGLIVSLNVDDQDTQSGVSVITPSNANTSADNRSQVTSGFKSINQFCGVVVNFIFHGRCCTCKL